MSWEKSMEIAIIYFFRKCGKIENIIVENAKLYSPIAGIIKKKSVNKLFEE